MNARNEKNEIKSRYERYKDVINDLTIMDDVFMRSVFKQKECLEYVLQVIMEMRELQVVEHVIQKDYKNLKGRSAILDCVAKDAGGKQFIEEVDEDFQDGAHIIYVNSGRQDDTELGRLMHDLHCKDADEIYSDILAKRVRELKEEAKGADIMSEKLEELYAEGIGIGEERGELKKAKEIALAMTEEGMEIGKIARLVKADVEDVQQWIDENMSVTK